MSPSLFCMHDPLFLTIAASGVNVFPQCWNWKIGETLWAWKQTLVLIDEGCHHKGELEGFSRPGTAFYDWYLSVPAHDKCSYTVAYVDFFFIRRLSVMMGIGRRCFEHISFLVRGLSSTRVILLRILFSGYWDRGRERKFDFSLIHTMTPAHGLRILWH